MKHAVVTGGTKGIGFAITKMLLQEGYHVVATYANDSERALKCRTELEQISPHFDIIKVNLANRLELKAFTKKICDAYCISCLVLNAGTTLRKSMVEIEDHEWDEVMQVNVNSNLFIVRDLFPRILPNSRIVFIGSLMGIHPHGTSIAYGVTKAAVHAMAQNLVKCFEGTGSTVNAIAPGFVETEWQKDKPIEIRNNICNKTALKRFASVEEIADAVKFCINNPFVNGSILEISGGYSYK